MPRAVGGVVWLAQASGVMVADECVNTYNDLKTGRKYKFIFFKLSANLKEIVVDKTGAPTATYDDFMNEIKALPKEDCRYAVFDFEWETAEGGKRQKIVFYAWYVRHPRPRRTRQRGRRSRPGASRAIRVRALTRSRAAVECRLRASAAPQVPGHLGDEDQDGLRLVQGHHPQEARRPRRRGAGHRL